MLSLVRAYSRWRSTSRRLSLKKQKGHWSEDGRSDSEGEGGEGGEASKVLVSSLSRCGLVLSAVSATLFQLNGFP